MISDKTAAFAKDGTGTASVIEAVLVYPVVILACSFLIYSCLFMCEESMLCDMAQKTAECRAEMISSGETGLSEQKSRLTAEDIRKIYDKKRKRSFEASENELKHRTEQKMKKMLFYSDNIKCVIRSESVLNGNKITVTLERIIHTPGILRLFSKDDIITEKASATEVSSDFCTLLSANKLIEKAAGSDNMSDERNGNDLKDEEQK